MKKDQIVLYTDQIARIEKASEQAGKFALVPTAEGKIVMLFKMKEQLDEFIEKVKAAIIEAGKKITPDFKGVTGEHVKAYIRASGFKYSYDKSKEKELLPFLKETRTYRLDTEKVEAYKLKNQKLPDGITENERKESLVVVIKDDEIILP